ncbi:D-alanyl-D-alanine carboxypeptidase [Gloeocapsopsis dulcis]|uniref:D-alanyl-D-alanine carboxypeptidase n=1 Tax=Gloeocapsopsis dulcis AAB1 = 1H9 TaxID=1433147 RepID=A0A6N8FV68_9CHRO|nr:D-alanyl-D-alanine carboxypeptidase [Gloeocapsopsis dulcis]MUL36749.1 D-alanyl-D-alanine carboxypeptidase [Gloeocapsopsis dulcis AAB1 = 1H9]WNN91322.1 D-alanyl-D-alanine carboxypeptidase [Gloeocapsopsis dulcis]
MLQLFGSGLISLWLEMAGLQPKPVDALEFFTLNSRPGLVLTPDAHPFAANTVQEYLRQLEATGLVSNAQGIWLQSGPVLLANNQGTEPLPAASITKVATSLAALKTWGSNHQFETLVGATGPIINGVLQGDLVIQGGGDPFFVWEEAIALGNSLNRMGIKQIRGNLVISGNFAMNYKTNPLQAGQLLQQAINAKTWSREATAQYLTMPQGTPRPQVAIAGTVQVTSLPNPKQILLVRHRSLPLSEILKEMNIYSNNEMSEMLAQNLGGAQVVQSTAATAAGVPSQEIQLINGSGLGVENRISPRAACAMLMAIQRELLPSQLSVADLFPVSGRDRRGTMEARRIPQAAVIKTGTLRDVSALAGVLPTRDRGLVWFAIINRGTNVEGLRARQDQLLQRLLTQWQVASTTPAAITPKSLNSTPIPLGAASRNEILYGG